MASLARSDFYMVYVRPTSAPLASSGNAQVSHDEDRLQSHGAAEEDKAGTETESDKHAMLYNHRVGTEQSQDILVYKDDKNPEWFWGAEVFEEDGRYLILSGSKDTSRKNLLWITDLEKKKIGQNAQGDKLIAELDAACEYVANDGTKFYFVTYKDAAQNKLFNGHRVQSHWIYYH